MPVLKDYRQTVTISLPDYEGSQVELFTSLLAGDYLETKDLTSLEIYAKYIKSWNFTDEAGELRPVTAENLRMLTPDAFKALSEAISNNTAAEKKDSSPSPAGA